MEILMPGMQTLTFKIGTIKGQLKSNPHLLAIYAGHHDESFQKSSEIGKKN